MDTGYFFDYFGGFVNLLGNSRKVLDHKVAVGIGVVPDGMPFPDNFFSDLGILLDMLANEKKSCFYILFFQDF